MSAAQRKLNYYILGPLPIWRLRLSRALSSLRRHHTTAKHDDARALDVALTVNDNKYSSKSAPLD